jgi:hypothetical protein
LSGSGVPAFLTGPDPLLQENKALQNSFLREVVRQANLLNQRTRLENQWVETEVKSLARYYFQLSRDEREARAKKAGLAAQRATLVRGVNGGSRGTSPLGSLRRSLAEVPHDEQLQTALRQEVSASQDADFVAPGTTLFRLVQADGTLSDPPAILLTDETSAASARAMTAFSGAWEEAAAALRSDKPITRRHIGGLTVAFASYKAAARELMADSRLLGARSSAQEYVASMQVLVDVLSDHRRCQRLKAYLKTGGFRFEGGTVADLVQWMDRNEVVPVYGSEPQLALASLTEQLVTRLDARINVLDEEIKSLKSQSPKHDAATKQRLANPWGAGGVMGGIGPAIGNDLAPLNAPLASGAAAPAVR